MANVLVEERSLQAIADAIRYKTGGSDTYKPRAMAPAIRSLPGSGVMQSLSVTENGDYSPEAGFDGFDFVSVAVPGGFGAGDEGKVVQNGALMPQTSLTVTANGTYDTTAKNSVSVNVSGGSGTPIVLTPTVHNASFIDSSHYLSINDSQWPNYRIISLKPGDYPGQIITISNTGDRNYWGIFNSLSNGTPVIGGTRKRAANGTLTFLADDFASIAEYFVYDYTSHQETPPVVTAVPF